ncbi:MAG: hypothetical protein NkDv07_0505 [Candidatus Improbicoccus devescovinae]|nr:MAG: hypothetical protein NkDv07_0505 [Candidatus Improbicoccus devescovinae]
MINGHLRKEDILLLNGDVDEVKIVPSEHPVTTISIGPSGKTDYSTFQSAVILHTDGFPIHPPRHNFLELHDQSGDKSTRIPFAVGAVALPFGKMERIALQLGANVPIAKRQRHL